MLLTLSLFLTALAPAPQDLSLLAAVPEDAFSILHLADPDGLRSRVERNDWLTLVDTSDGDWLRQEAEHAYKRETGYQLDVPLGLGRELHGPCLLFGTREVSGFLTLPPADPTRLAIEMERWLLDAPQQSFEVRGGRVLLVTRPKTSGHAMGKYLAFLHHPKALGLYSGNDPDQVLAALGDSLIGLEQGTRRAPVVQRFLDSGGGATRGLEAIIDYTPFVAEAEEALRSAVENVLPDPTGILGLEQGTWLFATGDVHPGSRVEVDAQLFIPEGTLASTLADSFEPLPLTLPLDLSRGTWVVGALDWNVSRFYSTARAAFEEADQEGLAMVDQGLAAAEAISGVDPIVDVLDQLSGLFAYSHILQSGATPTTGLQGLSFLVGLVDGDRFMDAFEAAFGAVGIGVEPVALEGAQAYLAGEGDLASDGIFGEDGGLAVLPGRLLVSWGRDMLVQRLRTLRRAEGTGLVQGSNLQAAFDENAGASGFFYMELSKLRAFAFPERWQLSGEGADPFEAQLIMAGRRIHGGFQFRIYTR